MNTAWDIIQTCKQLDVCLSIDGHQLVIRGPDTMPAKLIDEIRRKKAEIMRQLTINSVAETEGKNACLSNEAFTDRYLKLTRAHQAGIIDDNTLDQGLTFLLALWQPTQNGNDGNELKTMGTGRCLKLTCDA